MATTRTLLLLRHAKSSRDDPSLEDHDRPLAPRGVEAARRIAGHLSSSGVRPDLVLCSTARRARETLEPLLPAFGEGVEVEVTDELYGASADAILATLRGVDAGTASVMVIGHNPGLQDLALELVGGGNDTALQQLRAKFPTAALATFDVGDTAWPELGPDRATLTDLLLPRNLP